MSRTIVGAACGLVILASSGCFHVASKLPGVLDLRSDGGDCVVDHRPLPANATRKGFDAFAYGSGVSGTADVVIEDRNHYVINWMPIFNASSAEEWQSAVGRGALRDIAITERFGGMSLLLTVLKPCIPCVGPFITGTWDFKARATRILVRSSLRDEAIVPPPATHDAPSAQDF
jgi:hypothetical protein